MSFFDDKEETLDIELTQYGKYLVSVGKFNPKYYCFFDDDIIYDSKYANFTESQNYTQERILNETPVLKPQPNTVRREVDIDNRYNLLNSKLKSRLNDKTLLKSLGTSHYNSEYAPAWNIDIISGSMQDYQSGSFEVKKYKLDGQDKIYQDFVSIPQINMTTSSLKMSKKNVNSSYQQLDPSEPNLYVSFKDIENIFLVTEENTLDKKENFSIEIFKKEGDEWKQLHFYKSEQQIKEGILLDNPLYFQNDIRTDQNSVNWYFDLELDDGNEIPQNKTLDYDLYISEIDEGDLC